MKVISPPTWKESGKLACWFLAGGITGCPDWQAELLSKVDADALAYNPRRTNMPDGVDEVRKQIEWERRALHQADVISFWFPEETLCPITLFELGRWLTGYAPLLIGTHPNYARRFDVITQVGLERKGVEVVDSIDALAAQVQRELAKMDGIIKGL